MAVLFLNSMNNMDCLFISIKNGKNGKNEKKSALFGNFQKRNGQ